MDRKENLFLSSEHLVHFWDLEQKILYNTQCASTETRHAALTGYKKKLLEQRIEVRRHVMRRHGVQRHGVRQQARRITMMARSGETAKGLRSKAPPALGVRRNLWAVAIM